MADWRNGKRKGLGFKMMKTIILGYIVRLFPRILMEDKLGYPLKPDEDAHYKYHYQVTWAE